MDKIEAALTAYQNDRRQLQSLRRTRGEMIAQRQVINTQLPELDAQIDAMKLKVRASRQALIDGTAAE